MAAGNTISTIKSTARKSSQVIDGFIKGPQKPAIQSNEFHQKAQKAQTLMREGLKKPAKQFQTRLQRLTPAPRIETELRAKTTPRHTRVNRFGVPAVSSRFSPPFKAPKQSLNGEVISTGPNRAKIAGAASAAPVPSMITSVSHQRLERLLDEALAKADAHKQALRYQAARHFWQRRWFSGPKRWIVLVVGLLVVIGGTATAWETIPQLSVKVASIRAHLSAVIPSYKPEGYRMASPAGAASGKVTINYKSKVNPAQTYAIIQSESNLTSTLVAQNVVPKGASVQTSQVEGNTVYIYGPENDASWVNNGVLYTIKDNASLSSDELLNIVKGINP